VKSLRVSAAVLDVMIQPILCRPSVGRDYQSERARGAHIQ